MEMDNFLTFLSLEIHFLLFYFHLRMISHWYTSFFSRILRLTQHDQVEVVSVNFTQDFLDDLSRPTKPKGLTFSRWLWLSPAWIASSYTSGPPRMGPT